MKGGSHQLEKRPTILFVQYANPDFYPTTYNLSRMLAAEGYKVEICCRADYPSNIADYGEHVAVHRIGKRRHRLLAPLEFGFFFLFSLYTSLRTRASLVIGYDLPGFIVAGVIGRLLGKPFFYHVYDLFLPEEGIGKLACILKRYERGLTSRAAVVIFSSESKARLFLDSYRLDRRVFIVANSPPLQDRVESNFLRKRLAESGCEAAYVVYYHGSIGPGKGLLPVVRSIPNWPDKSVFVLLGIVYDEEFFAGLMQAASQWGVRDRVHYFGVVPFPELYEYTRSADLGVFLPESNASIHVYSGTAVVKLNDYMACGVPFLVSRIDALTTVAVETGAGCAVDVTDSQELGSTIRNLLQDAAARRRMGDAGYRLHRDRLNLRAQYAPVLEEIGRICELEAEMVTE